MVKKGRIRNDDSTGEDVWRTRKVYDEDDTLWEVAEPGINRRASDFIANFHATCVSDADHKHFIIPRQAENEAAQYEPTSPLHRSNKH